jgi:hypothetical protein
MLPLAVQGPTEGRIRNLPVFVKLSERILRNHLLLSNRKSARRCGSQRRLNSRDAQFRMTGSFTLRIRLRVAFKATSSHNLNKAQPVIYEIYITRSIQSFFPAIRKRIESWLSNGRGAGRMPRCLLIARVHAMRERACRVVSLGLSMSESSRWQRGMGGLRWYGAGAWSVPRGLPSHVVDEVPKRTKLSNSVSARQLTAGRMQHQEPQTNQLANAQERLG